MRILSQDGLHEGIIDVPYEQVSIEQREDEIWCGYFATLDKHCIGKCFAKYSTAEKAQKAMEMLRKAYSPILVIDNVSDEHIKADIKPFITPLRAGKPNVEVLDNFYFQFPADDEIEV